MQGYGLAPIRTDKNKELICVDPCSSAALIIFSQLRKPWENRHPHLARAPLGAKESTPPCNGENHMGEEIREEGTGRGRKRGVRATLLA
jgi:hypothetical protein